MLLAFALCVGHKIVIPEMTPAEAMVEVCAINTNPGLQHAGYEVIAIDGDDIVGTVHFSKGSELAVYDTHGELVQVVAA